MSHQEERIPGHGMGGKSWSGGYGGEPDDYD